MAVTVNTAGSIYTDQSGLLFTGRIKVAYVIIVSTAANATGILRDGTSGSASIKSYIASAVANSTTLLDFSNSPIVFANGIYLSSLSANTHVTIVTTSAG